MKKGIIIFLIILVILCGGFIVYYIMDSRNVDQENGNTISNVNTEENDNNLINNENTNNNTAGNNDEAQGNTVDESDDGTFIVRNVKNEDFNAYYKKIEIIDEAKDCVKIEKKDNTLILNLIESDTNEILFERGSVVSYDETYTISNVNANDVKTIFYGAEGQDIGYPLVLLLLNDGTVKGVDIQNGYQTGNFIAKNISGVENIVEFEQVDVTPPNDSGFIGVVAISKDNTIYSIQHQ